MKITKILAVALAFVLIFAACGTPTASPSPSSTATGSNANPSPSPEPATFEKTLQAAFDKLSASMESDVSISAPDGYKIGFELTGDISLPDMGGETASSMIMQLLNGLKVSGDVSVKGDQFVSNIDLTQGDLSGKLQLFSPDGKKAYLSLPDLTKYVIMANIEQAIESADIPSNFEAPSYSEEDIKAMAKGMARLTKKIGATYISAVKDVTEAVRDQKLTIGSETIDCDKFTTKLTAEQAALVVNGVVTDLKADTEFIDLLDKIYKDSSGQDKYISAALLAYQPVKPEDVIKDEEGVKVTDTLATVEIFVSGDTIVGVNVTDALDEDKFTAKFTANGDKQCAEIVLETADINIKIVSDLTVKDNIVTGEMNVEVSQGSLTFRLPFKFSNDNGAQAIEMSFSYPDVGKISLKLTYAEIDSVTLPAIDNADVIDVLKEGDNAEAEKLIGMMSEIMAKADTNLIASIFTMFTGMTPAALSAEEV